MSALPPKADMSSATWDVCFGPIADSCGAQKESLFDHFVGGLLKMHRHVETQSFGRLEIDDELILSRRLHRHVGGLLALEDAIDVTGCVSILVDEIGPIGNQAPISREEPFEVDRG